MPSTLTFIDVENFKSYKGYVRIGPLRQFMAVIGPNGSGKSNFMDAISFVMGEKTSSLRVKRLSDLIHGASIGQPVSRRASVSAIFELADKSEKKFTRIVQGSSSEFRINDDVVDQEQYANELENLGINVKAKNFLVFQGAVETIAMKNPKERTALFEEASGSGSFKEEYERTKAEMLKAEEDTQLTYLKKKAVAVERKEARLEQEEAEQYQELQEEHRDREIQLYLYKLFCTEEDIEKSKNEIAAKQSEVEKLQNKKDKMDSDLQKKKKGLGNLNRELAGKEKAQREKERELNTRRPDFIKAKENVAHIKKKLDSCKKSLEQAIRGKDAHEKDIAELEKQHRDIEEQEQEYLERTTAESQSQGQEITLGDEQLQEYWKLKARVQERSRDDLATLTQVNRKQKDDQEALDSFSRQKGDLDSRLTQLTHEIFEATNRVEKLSELIWNNDAHLDSQRRIRQELNFEVTSSKDKIQELQTKLNDINTNLGDARVDKHEEARRKKKQEIVATFKSHFAGVYDRMINMCQPRHPRYKVAVTKVMGKYLEAIVVDTEKTARACIQYLKEQMIEPETFLPLDNINANPINERLRNIDDTSNVHLVYDILEFDPKEIKRAVLFCTNNALVCENQEDANRVAYDLDSFQGQRFNAVALDGTFFTRSGIMSGGTMDLFRKAQRWDDKHLSKLKQDRDRLSEELRETLKKSRKESELNTVEQQISGLETRQKWANKDRDQARQQIQTSTGEQERTREELEIIDENITEIQKRLEDRNVQIQELKAKLNAIEDECFKSFCEDINVTSIRQFEGRELKNHQEREQQRAEFQNKKGQIKSQIDFEVSRTESVDANVERWTKIVSETKEALQGKQEEECQAKDDVDSFLERFESMKEDTIKFKGEIEKLDEEIKKIRREVGTAAKEFQSAQKIITQLEARQDQKKSEKHCILKQCKVNNIRIPFNKGSLDRVETEGPSNSVEDSTMSSQQIYTREARMKIDYSSLPDEYKGLPDDQIKRTTDTLNEKLQELHNCLLGIQAPNMRAAEKLDQAQAKFLETNEEFDNVRKRVRAAKVAFEKVKSERHSKFTKFYDHVASNIDGIYKALTQNLSAQAILGPENPEEPYLDGISYSCVAPGKRFQSMSNLSGGEKTVAALALLFAIHSHEPSPFFILDEIDAALDNVSIFKLATFISQEVTDVQIIIISLKEEFYGHADALIGVAPDVSNDVCMASQVYTLDLSQYQD